MWNVRCVVFCVCLLRILFFRFYFVVSLLFYFSFSSSTFSSRTMMMLMLSPNAAKKLNPNGNVETYTHARNHKYNNNKIISYFMFFSLLSFILFCSVFVLIKNTFVYCQKKREKNLKHINLARKTL